MITTTLQPVLSTLDSYLHHPFIGILPNIDKSTTFLLWWIQHSWYCRYHMCSTTLFGRATFACHSDWLPRTCSDRSVAGLREHIITSCLVYAIATLHRSFSFLLWHSRYLPPDPEFIPSSFDFPEIFLCLLQDCSVESQTAQKGQTAVIVPFVTFFSGHIATILIIANHLYIRKHTRVSVCLHCFNWFQAIRLLATRGHYSIDLIIGYVVAVFVSSPAERLGLYYSWRVLPTLPQSLIETFEVLVGVDAKTPFSSPSQHDKDPHEVQSETSVRVIVEIISGFSLPFLTSEGLCE